MRDVASDVTTVRREIYRLMALLKANDERVRRLLRSGRLAATYYSYRGQETIPAALAVSLNDSDYWCTVYRGIHDMLAKGLPLKQLWAEIAGRIDGTCKGKGGAMHLTYPSKGIMVTTGIVGSSMPIANGLAWAAQLQKRGQVAVASFGDGASNIGAFHESLNFASVWRLPVIFVCQNNLYAEHTAYSKGTAGVHIADRAAGYAMPGIHVDGNDVEAMYKAGHDAVMRARAGEGPTLIEAMTFRFHGHVMGDADAYMSPGEKELAVAADPVPRYRNTLLKSGVVDEEWLKTTESQIERDIDAAVEFALSSPYPELSELTSDVFAEEAGT